MDAFVIDVSACMPWCCVDEKTLGLRGNAPMGEP